MSTRPATARKAAARRRPQGRRSAAARRARSRRRLAIALGMLAAAGLGAAVVWPELEDAAREITLPLRHEDIIRQQASDKDLDPSLIAAVIYAESRFRDQTSHAGAIGLMQIVPDTARFIARDSGGTSFTIEDLSTPQVNIAYGAYYLRYLLNRYSGNETLAIAAYNGGEGNVDRWLVEASAQERSFRVQDIPFPETRAYVENVLGAQRDYRRHYGDELGL